MADPRILDARYETASAEEIRALQTRRVKDLLRRAWATNAFYRDLWRAANVDVEEIHTLEDFAARVPMVGKRDFLADQDDDPPYGRRHAYALGLGEPLLLATTSGTSGQGQEIHIQTAGAELKGTEQVYAFMFRWAGLQPGDQLFLAMPVTMLAGGRLEYHGAMAYGLTVHSVGTYDAARKIQLLRRFGPQTILANTSYLGRLALLKDREEPLPPLKCLISGGEGSGIEWLQRLEQAWSAPVYDRYGFTQSGNDHMFTCDRGIGAARRPGMLHNIDHMVLLEVIDPATGKHVKDGEEGEIVLTSLYHLDTPLVRCRVGDRAIFREGRSCGCGRPFVGVETASIARTDDMKKVKGVNIWPQAVDDLLFAQPQVEEYRVLLSSSADGGDVATLQVMTKSELGEAAGAALRDTLSAAAQRGIGIRFEVEVLAPGGLDLNEWKARRWLDERLHARRTAAAPTGQGDSRG